MEVLIYAQQIYREVEQELSSIEQNLTATDARVLAHLGFVGSDTLAAMSQKTGHPPHHDALRFAQIGKTGLDRAQPGSAKG